MAFLATLLLIAAPMQEMRPVPPVYWTGKCPHSHCAARHPGIKVVPERSRTWRS